MFGILRWGWAEVKAQEEKEKGNRVRERRRGKVEGWLAVVLIAADLVAVAVAVVASLVPAPV